MNNVRIERGAVLTLLIIQYNKQVSQGDVSTCCPHRPEMGGSRWPKLLGTDVWVDICSPLWWLGLNSALITV